MPTSSKLQDAKLTPQEKLALAQRLYREYYSRCFWHMKPDASITEAIIPTIVEGLRMHGGRRGAIEAAKLVH